MYDHWKSYNVNVQESQFVKQVSPAQVGCVYGVYPVLSPHRELRGSVAEADTKVALTIKEHFLSRVRVATQVCYWISSRVCVLAISRQFASSLAWE